MSVIYRLFSLRPKYSASNQARANSPANNKFASVVTAPGFERVQKRQTHKRGGDDEQTALLRCEQVGSH